MSFEFSTYRHISAYFESERHELMHWKCVFVQFLLTFSFFLSFQIFVPWECSACRCPTRLNMHFLSSMGQWLMVWSQTPDLQWVPRLPFLVSFLVLLRLSPSFTVAVSRYVYTLSYAIYSTEERSWYTLLELYLIFYFYRYIYFADRKSVV